MSKYPMTVHGAEALKEELHRLKFVDRPRIVDAIATARAHGDLKENAEYHAAREQQSFNEGRIQELEAKLSHAQIIDISKLPNNGKVVFGCTVTICNVANETQLTYQIVGEDEADIKQNKISYSSPIGRGLIGKELDDSVTVNTPGGLVEYEIIDVQYI
ncbi:transcription elongation factor GreA [Legionella longbeachae]|uniref:Transcription elongation factor GreA n=1 Tax=Legionella longbeachae serogroup 1 (strain NSW150) TaxID=661367 RepID=D3HM49_LEGLN|nr:transcription elongation factor GreA [Legionella longbeachae]VEE03961.1 transcription elongation factor GreA [Legionella oakridgensis]HBD7397257.1 transcription elongation factor GreA [Legionella pneumophila]ARB93182.1 transcription elongation factor GreA [Legionella longbeachae]ARM33754.1 transcription elongation factor GreA [Legionella longbeachae]EEZ97087.1 transcription elongation factor GreA domain protein [Legionella longbeachae D-4968]